MKKLLCAMAMLLSIAHAQTKIGKAGGRTVVVRAGYATLRTKALYELPILMGYAGYRMAGGVETYDSVGLWMDGSPNLKPINGILDDLPLRNTGKGQYGCGLSGNVTDRWHFGCSFVLPKIVGVDGDYYIVISDTNNRAYLYVEAVKAGPLKNAILLNGDTIYRYTNALPEGVKRGLRVRMNNGQIQLSFSSLPYQNITPYDGSADVTRPGVVYFYMNDNKYRQYIYSEGRKGVIIP